MKQRKKRVNITLDDDVINKLILFLERKSIKKNFKLALKPLLFQDLRPVTFLRF